MSYGPTLPDKWSDCSSDDFTEWWRKEGHTCVKEDQSQDTCKDRVKDVLDVAEIPECCNNADILLNYGECCKELFNGGEEACYQDPAQTTASRTSVLSRSLSTITSSYSTYSINWCQSEIRKATDLQANPVCCLNPFIRDKFKNDQEYRNECCIKLGLCADEKRRSFSISVRVCDINYCPWKIRGRGWITNYPECCWHPVRKYLTRFDPYVYKAECCTQQTECS